MMFSFVGICFANFGLIATIIVAIINPKIITFSFNFPKEATVTIVFSLREADSG